MDPKLGPEFSGGISEWETCFKLPRVGGCQEWSERCEIRTFKVHSVDFIMSCFMYSDSIIGFVSLIHVSNARFMIGTWGWNGTPRSLNSKRLLRLWCFLGRWAYKERCTVKWRHSTSFDLERCSLTNLFVNHDTVILSHSHRIHVWYILYIHTYLHLVDFL